jgi:hypothetical protein
MSDPGRAFKRRQRHTVNQALIAARAKGMARKRGHRTAGLGAWAATAALAAALVLAAGAGTADEEPGAPNGVLAGEYRHSAAAHAGKIRRSVATISERQAGLAIAWQEDEGNLFGGIGLRLDSVFGAAYTEALNGAFRGSGVLAYRIHDGTLEGLRLPAGSQQFVAETLRGSPALQGRFDIVRSVDAAGATYHSGHVEIERRGDTYQMTWFTPEKADVGVGLRIGDVLVAGYAKGFAPGLVAYCIDGDLLTGVSTYGHSGTVGADRLLRAGSSIADAMAQPSDYCRAAIDAWNPSLKL